MIASSDNVEECKSMKETVLEITDYPPSVFRAMLEFFYLGTTKVNSKELIDILYLCEEYILPVLKQAVETVI